MDKKPLVSICCLVYNHEPYLRECFDGFMMQKTNFDFEVLVHDDASTDNSASIIREYETKYPDIFKPIYQTENQYSKGVKVSATFNYPRAKGKYIAICEGDDYWTDPLKLQKQVDIMENDSLCQIVFAKIQPVSTNRIEQKWTIPNGSNILTGKIELKDFIKEEFYNCSWTFHTSSFVFRNKILDSYLQSGFADPFPFGDMPLLIYNLLNGYGYYIDDIVGCYRVLSGGYNSLIIKNTQFAISQDKKLIKALFFLDNYTNRKFHKYIKKKIRILQFNIDKKQYGKIIFLHPRYWNRTLNAFYNKFKNLYNGCQ